MRRFTADVSHELRTPLTAIRSVGEVGLREHRDEMAYRAIIGSMLEEVDRLSSLVERLLTLSRAETGQAKLSLELFGVRELAEDVVAHLDVLAEEKQQQITIEGAGTAHACADRLLVRRALINLVDNAIKFSPAGGSIRISVGGSGEEATIDVIDSGAGITAAGRDRIFDRFFRDGNIDGYDRGGRPWTVDCQRGCRGQRRPPDPCRDQRRRQHLPDQSANGRETRASGGVAPHPIAVRPPAVHVGVVSLAHSSG